MTKSDDVNKKENIIDCKPIKKQKNKKIDNEINITNKSTEFVKDKLLCVELSKDKSQPNITILENTLKNINIRYVVHMADIHIHKREREEEYRQVFNNLYVDLIQKNINKKNSIIVIAGDIIHDKTDLHPISITLTKEFFIMLCKITTVICIPGNHDVSLLNMQHNSIESIVKNLETENKLYLLNDEGYYQYYNILFGHTRFGQSAKVLECKFNFDGYKCGLYHGIINGVKDNNIEYKNTKEDKKYFDTNDFADYDFVFLGDIHKFGFLTSKKNIAYSGSLIQQTIDESLDKGYIFWDLEKGKGEFQKVHNDFGKIKIEIDEDGQSMYDVKKLPKKLDVRIDCKSLDRKYIEDIYKNLNENDIVINKKIDLMVGSKNRDTKILIGGKEQNLNTIKNTNDLSNLLILKLKENKQIDDKQINSYKKIIDELLQNYNFNDCETKRKIKLVELEFNNMSIYGENNKIDFTKFKNIMGIIAPNSSGKSSFIDVILYSIFENCTRGDRFDLLNKNKTSFKSKIKLEINDVKYTIIRTLTRNSKKSNDIKAGAEIYENGINISGKDKSDTDKIISQKMGDIYDFIITSIVTQKSLFQGKSIGFVELSSNEKRDILCKLARLDIYDNLYNDTSTKLKSFKAELNKYNIQLKKYNTYGKDIINIRLNFDKKKNEMNDEIKKLDKDNKELNDKLEEYKKIKYKMMNYDFLKVKNIKNINKNNMNDEIEILKNKINKINKKIDKLKLELNEIGNIKEIETEYQNNKNKQIQKYNNDINQLTKELWTDTSIDYNKFNDKKNDTEINKMNKERNDLENKIKNNNDLLQEINKELNKKIKIIDKKDVDEYNKLKDELNNIENQKEKETQDLIAYQNRLDNLGEHEFDPKCKFCMKNTITKEKILLENSITLLNNNIKNYNLKIKKLNQSINKKKKIVDAYNIYLELNDNKQKKENDKIILTKDNEIYNEKLKNIDNKVKELEQNKQNYQKYLENNNIEKKIEDIQNKIDELNNDICEEKIKYDDINKDLLEYLQEIEELQNELIFKEKENDEINENADLYEKYKIYIDNEKNLKNIQTDIDNINENMNKLNKENILIKENDFEITLIEKNINECNKKHDQYMIINNILKNGGLIESIMKDNLLPRFNEIVNNLFVKFGSRQVVMKFERKEGQQKETINIYDENGVNTSRDGGYQSVLNNLIYRIGLAELNPNMKSTFMIIDEAMDSADPNNKQEMKKLITYLRSQYEWIMIVSHNDDVKDTFDNIIEITDNKNDDNTCDGTKYISY